MLSSPVDVCQLKILMENERCQRLRSRSGSTRPAAASAAASACAVESSDNPEDTVWTDSLHRVKRRDAALPTLQFQRKHVQCQNETQQITQRISLKDCRIRSARLESAPGCICCSQTARNTHTQHTPQAPTGTTKDPKTNPRTTTDDHVRNTHTCKHETHTHS